MYKARSLVLGALYEFLTCADEGQIPHSTVRSLSVVIAETHALSKVRALHLSSRLRFSTRPSPRGCLPVAVAVVVVKYERLLRGSTSFSFSTTGRRARRRSGRGKGQKQGGTGMSRGEEIKEGGGVGLGKGQRSGYSQSGEGAAVQSRKEYDTYERRERVGRRGAVHTAVPRDVRHIARGNMGAHWWCYVVFNEKKQGNENEQNKRIVAPRRGERVGCTALYHSLRRTEER